MTRHESKKRRRKGAKGLYPILEIYIQTFIEGVEITIKKVSPITSTMQFGIYIFDT